MQIVYHTDLDGYCSGAIAYNFFANNYSAEKLGLIPMEHNRPFPFEKIKKNEHVVILDYSLKKGDWNKLLEITTNITWIDHHISSIKKFENLKHLNGIRKSGTAACELTWDFYYKSEAPLAVKLIADYDVWTFKYPDTKDFQLGIHLINLSPDSYDWKQLLLNHNREIISNIVENGKIINRYVTSRNEHTIKSIAYVAEFEGIECICCNQKSGSLIFGNSNKDYKICSTHTWNGEEWVVSLYSSNPEVDCSQLAMKYGGGGHKGSAGFSCKTLPFKFLRKLNNN